MENESELFYNSDLNDFENLNMTTPSIYDLGDYDVLIVLEDGSNITDWDDVESLGDVAYISEDLSGVSDLTNYYYQKRSGMSNSNPLKSLKAIVARNVKSEVDSIGSMFYGLENLTTISGLDSWDTVNVEDMGYAFAHCRSLTTVSGLESLSLENARSINSMFRGCRNMSDFDALKSWDVKDVLDMDRMFGGCLSFNDLTPILEWSINDDCMFESMFEDCTIEDRMAFYSNWQKRLLNSFPTVFNDMSRVVVCTNCGKFDMAYDGSRLVCNSCGEILKDFPSACPGCGSDNMHFDFRQMELMCRGCGLVIDSMDDEIAKFEEAYFKQLLADDKSLKARLDLLDGIEDDGQLYSYAMDGNSIAVMKRACERITNEDYLAKIALNHPNSYMRRIAYEKIHGSV